MSTRWLILKLTATLAALICGGCNLPSLPVQPVPQPKPVEPQTINLKITLDGEGKVSVSGGAEVNVRNAEPADVGQNQDLPEVLAYVTLNCPTCSTAKREIAAARDLPFRVTWKESSPSWVTTFPTFHWHVSGDDWRQRDRWDGVEKFVDMWKRSREPKKTSAASRPFAQPDRSSVGARSVAQWSINGDFTPSRSVLLNHLTNDGIHRGQHDREILESLTTEQLRWLHDRDHGN